MKISPESPYTEFWGPEVIFDLGSGACHEVLVSGWSYHQTDPDGTNYRWSQSNQSVLHLDCPALRDRLILIRGHRLPVSETAGLTVSVELNGTVLGSFDPTPSFSVYRVAADADSWRLGENELRLVYSESAYIPEVMPGSSDRRVVALNVDWVRIDAAGSRREPEDIPDTGSYSGEIPLHDCEPGSPETISLIAPADLASYFRVPRHGELVFGLKNMGLMRAAVSVSITPEGGEPVLVYQRQLTPGETEHVHSEDLSPWEDRFVRLTFSTTSTGLPEDDGESGVVELIEPGIWVPIPRKPGGESLGHAENESVAAADAVRPDRPAPDVVFYVMDALRADHLSAYGYPRRTSPVLDRLSKQGWFFRRAFAQAPNTVPSVKSFLTGRYLPFTGRRVLSSGHRSLPQFMQEAGYATGFFPNNPNLGPDLGYYRGFDHVDREIYFDETPLKNFAGLATDSFIRWAADVPHDQPLFAYIHTIHPHNPYQAPPPFDRVFHDPLPGDAEIDLSTDALRGMMLGRIPLTAASLRKMIDLYDGDILYNDLEMGRLLAWSEQAGRPGGTIFVLTADHGEELADHGGLLHGYTLYDDQIHVPLIIGLSQGFDAAEAGETVDGLVQLVDLVPTLLELCRIGVPPEIEGVSLAPIIHGEERAAGKRTVYSSGSTAVGLLTLRTERWKYVYAPRTRNQWGMGQGLGRSRELHYLFDLENDPGETRNLALELETTRKSLQGQLLRWIREQEILEAERARDEGVSVEDESPPPLDEDTERRLRALGYLSE